METAVQPQPQPQQQQPKKQQPYSPHLKKVLKSYQLTAGNSLSGPSCLLVDDNRVQAKLIEQEVKKEPAGHVTNTSGGDSATRVSSSVCESTVKERGTVVSTASKPSNGTPSDASTSSGNGGNVGGSSAGTGTISSSTTSTTAAAASSTSVSTSEYEPFLTPPPFPIQQLPILTAPDQSRSERCETVLEGESISCFVVGGERRLCLPQILNSVLRVFTLAQINQVCDELQIFCSRCNPEQLEVLKVTGVLPMSAPSCGLITKTDAERLCSALLHRSAPRLQHLKCAGQDPGFSFRVYHECFGKCKGLCLPDIYSHPSSRCIECVECHGMFSPQKFVCHAHRALEHRTCHWGFDSDHWRAYLLLAKDQEDYDKLVKVLDEFKGRFENASSVKRKLETETVITKEELSKRSKYEDNSYSPTPYVYADPYMYWYQLPWNRFTAIRPWSPLVANKEGKALPSHPSAPSHVGRESAVPSLPSYLSHSPPVLLNPERVVPLADSERFESSYQPNVALAPPSQQQKAQQAVVNGDLSKAASKTPAATALQKPEGCIRTRHIDSLKAPTYNSEFELSSDTDETSSDFNGDAAAEEAGRECDLSKFPDLVEWQGALDELEAGCREKVKGMLLRLHEKLVVAERSRQLAVAKLEKVEQQMHTAHLHNQRLAMEVEALRQWRDKQNGMVEDDIAEAKFHAMQKDQQMRLYRQKVKEMSLNSSHVSVITTSPPTIKIEALPSPTQ